eukprot:2947782-Heterocapsa_arctica.AAC.1
MEMIIRVEELLTVEDVRKCYPFKKVMSRCGKTTCTICDQVDCYRCSFLQKAVVNFEIDKIKGETIRAMATWRQDVFWTEASTKHNL